METITLILPDDRLSKLKEMAGRLGVAPEDLVRVSVEDMLSQPDENFRRAMDHVLKKNASLYQRLA